MTQHPNYLIIGAGFSGAVVAEQLSLNINNRVTIIDERPHVGGNCYTERDMETNVMIHKYGPHIFHTDNIEVWNYITRFCEMMPFINRVKAIHDGHVYSLPVNLHTINQFFGKTFNPEEAKNWILQLGDKNITEPQNFEEQAMSLIGKELYYAFFYGYTKKQWGCYPTELPASILKRIPVRFNYDDNYYTSSYQGIPKDGYTSIFDKMLDRPNIEIRINTKYDAAYPIDEYDHVFYTGPIDAYFNYKYGRLGYRTVFFERGVADGDYQGNAVINYSDEQIPYTRVHEHKHFSPWKEHDKTVYFKEFSKETSINDIPYYPKRLSDDLILLNKYQAEVNKLDQFTFLGRLATYRYMDMHHVINEALQISKSFLVK
jgi:UDP-galactopyranose mutase